MGNNDLISIIVPAYKVEQYLSKCIDSILAQTYTNFELILVEDGSPDNCGNICDEYAKRDSRVRVIHKENAGVSAARNDGISFAKGAYITFVDGDDFIDKAYLEVLFEAADKYCADMVFCGFDRLYGSKVVKHREPIEEGKIADPYELRTKFLSTGEDTVFGCVYRVLYKKELLENIRFNMNLSVMEDKLFILQAVSMAKSVVYCGQALYHYRIDITPTYHRYRKGLLDNHVVYATEITRLFDDPTKNEKRLLQANLVLLCQAVIANEVRHKQKQKAVYRCNTKALRESMLYKYYTVGDVWKIQSVKQRIKCLLVLLAFKLRVL